MHELEDLSTEEVPGHAVFWGANQWHYQFSCLVTNTLYFFFSNKTYFSFFKIDLHSFGHQYILKTSSQVQNICKNENTKYLELITRKISVNVSQLTKFCN